HGCRYPTPVGVEGLHLSALGCQLSVFGLPLTLARQVFDSLQPNWGRRDERFRRAARIRAARALEAADRADGHVVVAEHLTRQPDSAEAFGRQHHLLRRRHPRGLALDEHAAPGRAAALPTA